MTTFQKLVLRALAEILSKMYCANTDRTSPLIQELEEGAE